MSKGYKCRSYPCIHVVVDYSKKIYALFLETVEGDIYYIPSGMVLEVAEKVHKLSRSRFREAAGSEIDWLASEKLGAEKVVEE